MYGLRRTAFALRAKPAPNLQHQHRIVSSLRDFLRGVRHGHAALEEQLFEVAQAQLEAEIPTHCATDDASRKTVPRKIVTDQLRSYQAAKTEIPELASVKHVFVKAAARLNLRRLMLLSDVGPTNG